MTERIDKAERVREFYRKQGEKREQDRIIAILHKLQSAPACFQLDLDALIKHIKNEGETNE
jgi:hypothetical protein